MISRFPKKWIIPHPKQTKNGNNWRVATKVCGESIWFESSDVELSDHIEAFASLFFIPAMAFGASLRLESPADEMWLKNTRKLTPIFAKWWNYSPEYPVVFNKIANSATPVNSQSGLFFTGGMDSFYSLLRSNHRTDFLVFVHGFDVPIEDEERMNDFHDALCHIAKDTGRSKIVVRTNLRSHPVFSKINWERTHGAALAAVAHLLAPHISKMLIASSFTYKGAIPWGSHPDTDNLWSCSNSQIIHDDASFRRRQKIEEIGAHPLVQQYVRVCWENLSRVGNCSRCDKCLRTMAVLAVTGQLQNYAAFDHSVPLHIRIDKHFQTPLRLHHYWHWVLENSEDSLLCDSIERLLKRSSGVRGAFRKIMWRLFKG
jgi:hypothetical protein